MSKTITINARSRNLGLGWTNQPTGEDAYSIKIPSAPDHVGGLAAVERGLAEAAHYNSGGTFYNVALFVGSQRVIEIVDPPLGRTNHDAIRQVIWGLRDGLETRITVKVE
jgi:hypothetical protein